jgi:glycosyltransferase involved in cell wall biosynthesis
VPCFNEADRLKAGEFVKASKGLPDLHFIFVDDGSTDRTADLLEALCRENPDRLHQVRLERNFGKAEAVRWGFLKAFEMQCRIIGFWDADLAAPLEAVGELCGLLDNDPKVEIVLGSRVRLMGRHIQRRPLRHYLGRLLATAVSLILRQPVYDTQCGAKVFRNTEDLREVFAEPFRSRWIFDVEILARFIRIGRRRGDEILKRSCVEYPLRRWSDVRGSKIRLMDLPRVIPDLWRIARILHGRARDTYPVGEVRQVATAARENPDEKDGLSDRRP